MCEIFAASLHTERRLNEYLSVFFSHSENHPHGWGLAINCGNAVSIEKEPMKASKSHYLRQRLSNPVKAKNILAHIRYATIGNVEYNNCHPYTGTDNYSRRWTLIHNGTIFDYPKMHKFLKYQQGDTDSERILLFLLEQINNKQEELKRPLNSAERFALLDENIADISKGNKLNLLIFDGDYLYVHTNCKGTLHYLEDGFGVMFSTQPLSDESWKPVPFTTLLAYKNGKLRFTGKEHGNEYIDDGEALKYLYQIFSDL